MFSGIIKGLGRIHSFESTEISIITEVNLSDCEIGSSICCNGVCLTAKLIKKMDKNNFIFVVNISEETKKRTNFKNLNLSKMINIEKSLKVGDEIAGHFVYGHVDCESKISKIQKLDLSWNFEFNLKGNMKKFVVEKGSVTVNGISLTVANVLENSFSVSIIPHTYLNTNLNLAKVNDFVNIEFDPISRYINLNE